MQRLNTEIGPVDINTKNGKVTILKLPVLPQAKRRLTTAGTKFWLYEDILNLTPDLREAGAFRQKVWRCIRKIPYGRTVTYKDIAVALKMKSACRAVGNACKANPTPLVVPCHRVLLSNGRIGGYSSGVKWKKFLLRLERSRMK